MASEILYSSSFYYNLKLIKTKKENDKSEPKKGSEIKKKPKGEEKDKPKSDSKAADLAAEKKKDESSGMKKESVDKKKDDKVKQAKSEKKGVIPKDETSPSAESEKNSKESESEKTKDPKKNKGKSAPKSNEKQPGKSNDKKTEKSTGKDKSKPSKNQFDASTISSNELKVKLDFDIKKGETVEGLKEPNELFVKLVCNILKKQRKKFSDNFVQYKTDIKNNENLLNEEYKKLSLTADCSILVQLAYDGFHYAIFEILKIGENLIDINKLVLKYYKSASLPYVAAEKAKFSILKKCLKFDDLEFVKIAKDIETKKEKKPAENQKEEKPADNQKEPQKQEDAPTNSNESIYSQCLMGYKYTKLNTQDTKSEYRRDYSEEYEKCVDLLMDDKRFKEKLEILDPMYEAIKNRNDHAIEKLIEKFGLDDIFLDEISNKAFHDFLDSRITQNAEDDRWEISYEFLKKSEQSAGISVIYKIAKNHSLQSLITHPVISSYVNEKSNKFDKFYKTNTTIFLFLYILPLLIYYGWHEYEGLWIVPFIYLVIRELFQFVLRFCIEMGKPKDASKKSRATFENQAEKPKGTSDNLKATLWNHFKSGTNIIDFTLIILTVPPIFHLNVAFKIALIAFGSLEIFLMLSEAFSRISIFMLMLQKVVKNYVMLFCSIVIWFNIAFALCFRLVLDNDKFSDAISSIFNVQIMFGGEYEANGIDGYQNGFFGIFFVFFVVSIILLTNFMNAVAIADISVSEKFF